MAKAAKNKPRGNYEVGYCRPPKNSRWSAGQSGNPKGPSAKASLDTLECLSRALNRTVRLPVNGKMKTMSLLEVVAEQLVADAAKGNASARRELFKLMDFAEAVDQAQAGRVIYAQLVLEDDPPESRLVTLNQENYRLHQEIDVLKAQLAGSPPALPSTSSDAAQH